MRQPVRSVAAYVSLLMVQTAAASSLFWIVLPIFQRLISRLGEPQELEIWRVLMILAAVFVLQSCYWIRINFVAVCAPFRNILLGHLLLFASRISFFFGGAFFGVLFFRHVPELDAFPPVGQGLLKGLAIAAILFSLYCYSLELERLGKAVEEHS